MSSSEDKKPPSPSKAAPEPTSPKQSGRVAFDPRGNPTWEWQTSTGVFGRDVSTQRLKKLEAKELSLVDTQKIVAKPKGLALEDAAETAGGGCNPYNSSTPTPKKPTPVQKSGAAGAKNEWWAKQQKKPHR